MSKKNVFLIGIGIILVLFVDAVTVWAVTDLPHLIPPPKATVSDEPYTGKVNDYDGLSMTIDPESVTPTSATLVLHNETDYDLSSGHSYGLRIHVLRDGQWYPMELRTDKRAVTSVPDIMVYYPVHTFPYTTRVSWKSFHGRLESGHYRLVWTFIVDETNGDTPVLLTAEFDVK